MVAASLRKIKAFLLIAILAGAEVHPIQQKTRLRVGSFGKRASSVDVGRFDFDLDAINAGPNIEERWRLLLKPLRELMGDSRPQAEDAMKGVAKQMHTMIAKGGSQEQANEFAEQLMGIQASTLWQEQAKAFTERVEQATRVADQTEALMSEPFLQEQARRIAEQVMAILTDPTVQEQATEITKQAGAMTTGSYSQEQAHSIAKQLDAMMSDAKMQDLKQHVAKEVEAVITNPQLQGQANAIQEQMKELTSSPQLQAEAREFAEQIEKLTADPRLQEQAAKLAEEFAKRIEALPDARGFQQHADSIAEQMEVMMADLAKREQAQASAKKGESSVDLLSDNLVDSLLDRALVSAPQLHRAGLEKTTLGKSGRAAAIQSRTGGQVQMMQTLLGRASQQPNLDHSDLDKATFGKPAHSHEGRRLQTEAEPEVISEPEAAPEPSDRSSPETPTTPLGDLEPQGNMPQADTLPAQQARGPSAAVMVSIYIISSILSSVLVVLCNKAVFIRGFSFPLTVSFIAYVFIWLYYVFLQLTGAWKPTGSLPMIENIKLACSSIGSISFMNLCLLTNTVAIYQITKFAVIPMTLLLQKACYTLETNLKVLASLAIIIGGVAYSTMTSFSAGTLSVQGIVFALLAVFTTAVYRIWQQTKQKEYNIGPVDFQATMAAWQAGLGLIAAVVVECFPLESKKTVVQYAINVYKEHFGGQFPSACLWMLGTCIFALAVNFCSFGLIGKTGPVTYAVVGHAKTVLTIIAGLLFFPREETRASIIGDVIGCVVAMLGVVSYGHFEYCLKNGKPDIIQKLSKEREKRSAKE